MRTIYVIQNKVNGKFYVGQTKKTAEQRFNEHKNKSKDEKPKMIIARAIKKYGQENFFIVETIVCSDESANSVEEENVIKYNSLQPNGYNVLKFGQVVDLPDGWWKGKERSEETKQKISESKKGKCTGEENHFYGKHHTKESIEKANVGRREWYYGLPEEERKAFNKRAADARIGHEVSPETRAKISAANKGRSNPEAVEKMRKTKTGSKWSDKQRAALEKINVGRVHTEEAKANYTKAQRNRVPAETKARILKIKELILEGRDNKTIAELTGADYEMVRNIRRDRRGKSVPWPKPYTPAKAWCRS